jgi:opacity protein-like surface antigen
MAGRTFGWLGLVAVLTGTALAAEPGAGDPGRTGWYLGAGATYALEQFRSGRADDSPGLKMLGGYRAHRHFAAELDVDYLNGFDVRADGDESHVRGVATTLNGKGYLTTGRIQPYGVAGLGGLYVSGIDRSLQNLFGVHGGFLTRFGAGLDLYATDHLVVNAEATYDLPTGAVSALRFVPITLGAQYRF